MLQALDAEPDRYDLSKLRSMVIGGSAVPKGVIEAYQERHGIDVVHAWGMTEMSPIGSVAHLTTEIQKLPADEQLEYKARALAFAETRGAAFDPGTAVLVHGDAHNANALRAPERGPARERFKLVDPDGLLAERAYDLAIPMREWSGELLGGDVARLGSERCGLLACLTGVGTGEIWEWGFVERVSTGLLATRVGAERLGGQMLAVAEAWATV